jgi:3-oxoacyl-[acyl-carrier protein] reductase
MDKLKKKVAIVTGASKGIGAAIASALAAEGASVVVNYATSQKGADGVVADITARGGKAIAVGGSVSKAADVATLFERTRAAFGAPNVLVNNAGVFKFEPFTNTTEETFRWQYETNVLGPILTTLEAIKCFSPDGGSIINTSSIVGSHARPMASIYGSSKAALDNLTRSLAMELGSRNIRVNAIAPGHTETEGTADMFAGSASIALAKESAFNRMGKVTDVAPAVIFLASDEAAWITGEVIRIGGGAI